MQYQNQQQRAEYSGKTYGSHDEPYEIGNSETSAAETQRVITYQSPSNAAFANTMSKQVTHQQKAGSWGNEGVE